MAFAQFPEQWHAIELLRRSLERGRLSHAYLFSGASLSDLETVARALAKTLICRGPHPMAPAQSSAGSVRADSCDQCPSCRRIDEDNHPDVQWVRPESKLRIITIDQIRELMQTVNLKPTEADWKVAVIVAADRLNVQAGNAFLKTLEEPPPRSIILLLSTEPERLLETVLSRCLRLNFGGDTGPAVDAAYLEWLGSFSEMTARGEAGLLGRYRLLGSLLAKLNEIKSEADQGLSARSPLERYEEIDQRLRDKWEDELAAAIEAEYRRRRGDLLLAVQWWLRDVWLAALPAEQGLFRFPALAKATAAVATRISSKQALQNLEVMEQTQRLLGSNVQEALALEVGLLKLAL